MTFNTRKRLLIATKLANIIEKSRATLKTLQVTLNNLKRVDP